MNTEFNNLPWHDAILHEIFIDRAAPGERDVVRLSIIWPDSDSVAILEFYDCYFLTLNMNFGIVASESILMAECVIDSQELQLFRTQWKVIEEYLKDLKLFKIETNSTNSLIHIYALGFRIL